MKHPFHITAFALIIIVIVGTLLFVYGKQNISIPQNRNQNIQINTSANTTSSTSTVAPTSTFDQLEQDEIGKQVWQKIQAQHIFYVASFQKDDEDNYVLETTDDPNNASQVSVHELWYIPHDEDPIQIVQKKIDEFTKFSWEFTPHKNDWGKIVVKEELQIEPPNNVTVTTYFLSGRVQSELIYFNPTSGDGLHYTANNFNYKNNRHYDGVATITLTTNPDCNTIPGTAPSADTTIIALQINSTTLPFPNQKKVQCDSLYDGYIPPDIWQFVSIDFDNLFTSSSTHNKPVINPSAITF